MLMATAPSPNDLTRQQLDELDALLQRMLSVPLVPADTPAPVTTPGPRAETPPLPPIWRVDPPAPSAGASLPHIDLPETPPATVKFEPPVPPAPKSVATAPAPASAPKAAPTPAPVAKPQATPTKPQAAPAPQAPLAPSLVPSAPPVPLPLLPLVAVNALFDSVCGIFGPLGRLLRSGFFKHIYGLVGLGLLAYTVAHVAQEQRWLTLPIMLPWPR
jgi:hypothetical protein